jgi:hypothetical protein
LGCGPCLLCHLNSAQHACDLFQPFGV